MAACAGTEADGGKVIRFRCFLLPRSVCSAADFIFAATALNLRPNCVKQVGPGSASYFLLSNFFFLLGVTISLPWSRALGLQDFAEEAPARLGSLVGCYCFNSPVADPEFSINIFCRIDFSS